MSSNAFAERRVLALREAYLAACRLELRALKPGNVHVFAAGHGMTVAQFETSAQVSAAPLCVAGKTVGARIRDAIAATYEAVGCNTNLGIVLLAAPLLQAAERCRGRDLRPVLSAVLDALTVADAEAAYEAIRLARPAGMGSAAAQDIANRPTVDLKAAMALAAPRDLIARQYGNNYAEVFSVGVAALRAAVAAGHSPEWATTLAYLGFLAGFPDSHIARKWGAETAEAVRRAAAALAADIRPAGEGEGSLLALFDFDQLLKSRGLNPGSSADLTVASLLAWRCEAILVSSADQEIG